MDTRQDAVSQDILENVGCGFGMRVPTEEAGELWEAWAGTFRTNAFRRVRPLTTVSPMPVQVPHGVEVFATHPSQRLWIVLCIWKGVPECFVHRPSSQTTYRVFVPLRDDAWRMPMMFTGELEEETGIVWLDDCADRRKGDWPARMAFVRSFWNRHGIPALRWRAKEACVWSGARPWLVEAPLDGGQRVLRRYQMDPRATNQVETVWKARDGETVGSVLIDGRWLSPRFADVALYRHAVARVGTDCVHPCRCRWNAHLKCWDLVAWTHAR